MASSHPFKNSLGTFCLCAIALFSAALGIAQDNNVRKLLKKAPVGYPYILKSKGIGGIVKLKVFIKPDGTVRDTVVVGGNPILAERAVTAVKSWKYAPAPDKTVEDIALTFSPH